MTPPQQSHARRQLRRAVLSSYLGSVIEYYDFLLYATASAVVFNQVFFSDLDPLAGTVASFGTLATGYLARPLGGALFGHFGDRLGRKRMLILTMALMGLASVLIGVLPSYATIGAWAPVRPARRASSPGAGGSRSCSAPCCWPSACSCGPRSRRRRSSWRRRATHRPGRRCSRCCASTRATCCCRSASASARSSPRGR